ncbi:hypothetical protein ACIHFE_04520 [Streptomyces sp. NPDC052396]|uniref:hypothetical protein n=1 Tax=Streptomyces sp. NPDC052396 TaxID=3365689 RepID=UPI0037D72759
MSRSTFKFADWVTVPDEGAAAEYLVLCRDVIPGGDQGEHDTMCRWEYRVLDDREEADKQQKAHAEETGHRLFVERSTCYTIISPPPGSVLAGRLARQERAVAIRTH